MSTTPLEIGQAAPVPGAGSSIPEPNENKGSVIEEMMPAVYEDLRRLAGSYLRGARAEHTPQGTALVHEAYLRLVHQGPVEWQNRAHFIVIFARLMRQTLTNHAVAKNRLKRGGADPL